MNVCGGDWPFAITLIATLASVVIWARLTR